MWPSSETFSRFCLWQAIANNAKDCLKCTFKWLWPYPIILDRIQNSVPLHLNIVSLGQPAAYNARWNTLGEDNEQDQRMKRNWSLSMQAPGTGCSFATPTIDINRYVCLNTCWPGLVLHQIKAKSVPSGGMGSQAYSKSNFVSLMNCASCTHSRANNLHNVRNVR